MTYIAQESSIENGSPIELYEVAYGAEVWRYTSGDTSFFETAGSRTYEPMIITRPNLIFSSDYSRSSIVLTVKSDAPFLQLFRVAPPSGVISLTIKRTHRTDTASEIVTIWKGRMLNVSWEYPEASVTCESILSSVQRFGLRRMFQLQCPHVLYGDACRASKASFVITTTVTAISGLTVTASGIGGQVDGYFAGGYIEWESGEISVTERRMILNSQTSTGALGIMASPLGLTIGDSIRLYPGCAHTIDICHTKFNNSANYGGMPYTPDKGLFGGEVTF